MSDEDKPPVKDFRYYADKAEQLLLECVDPMTTLPGVEWRTQVATVYARLAAIASEAVPVEEPYYHVNGLRMLGRRCGATLDYRQCVLAEGHDDKHLVQGGARFDD